ncbi:hypothetical protein AXK11_03380 [Cephaloticoccus primus]|uniref:DUF4412 domain-containing protein n=1 Tax=Cephaloticoccus primus TaxID=1548207 RepID=A0A139SQJ5_9BACT|nr:DUF4412 domain-containing protein [Cephaloticoccus primus]KXU36846.1 hypothetical protein AXK11_03380 [Cephaloticoccus primus]
MQKLIRLFSLAALLCLPFSGTAIAQAPATKPSKGKAAAKQFEGKATVRLTHDQVGTHVLNYSVKGSRLHTEFQISETAQATAIVDLVKDEVFVLLPGQPLYVSMSLENSAEFALGQSVEQISITKTREHQKILGYRCAKYLVQNQDDRFEVWATEQLGSFMGLGLPPDAEAKFHPEWIAALVGKGFFPLRVQSLPGSKNTLTIETLSVEPGEQPDTLFAPPAGYRKFQMGGLIEGLLGKH